MLRLLNILILVPLTVLLLDVVHDIGIAHWLPAAAPDSLYGLPVGDFGNDWSAGTLARTGQLATLYDPAAFSAWKLQTFHHPIILDDWVYPPFILPLMALFSFMPPGAGFVLWNFLTLAAMAWLLRSVRLPWGAVALCLACPAEWLCLVYGQLGGIIGALSFAALMTRTNRAGLWLGLCAAKPQTVLVLPIAWLAARRWRALFTAVATGLVLAVLPLLLFGPASWLWWFTRATRTATALVEAPFGSGYQYTGTSVFWMLRSFGATLHTAYTAQIVTALAAIAATYALWRTPSLPQTDKACLTLLLGLFVSPYGFSADMIGYSIALVVLARRRPGGFGLLDGLFLLWPGYAMLPAVLTGHLFTPLVVAAALARAWWQCARRSAVPPPP